MTSRLSMENLVRPSTTQRGEYDSLCQQLATELPWDEKMGKQDYGDRQMEVNRSFDSCVNKCTDRCADFTEAGPSPVCATQECTRMDEPGPCGKNLSIQINPEVEIAYVTIPRRAHMWRRSSAEGREGTGHNPVPCQEMPEREKLHKRCIAIRDAGNLAIETGSRKVSANSSIPKYNKKTGLSENMKSCITVPQPVMLEAIPIAGTDCQLRCPVLWYDNADMVFHFSFNLWITADTVDKQDKVAVKATNTPILYGHDPALQEFAGSECFWHFDNHLSPDKPRHQTSTDSTTNSAYRVLLRRHQHSLRWMCQCFGRQEYHFPQTWIPLGS